MPETHRARSRCREISPDTFSSSFLLPLFSSPIVHLRQGPCGTKCSTRAFTAVLRAQARCLARGTMPAGVVSYRRTNMEVRASGLSKDIPGLSLQAEGGMSDRLAGLPACLEDRQVEHHH